MICRERLFDAIRSLHRTVVAYAMCVCDEENNSEDVDVELVFQFGITLSEQLLELRKLAKATYGIDPICNSADDL